MEVTAFSEQSAFGTAGMGQSPKRRRAFVFILNSNVENLVAQIGARQTLATVWSFH